MINVPETSVDWSERALAMLLADGVAARRLAFEALQVPGRRAGQRALAHVVIALCEAREGAIDECLRQCVAAEALIGKTAAGLRAADLLQHAMAQWHRREGRPGDALALLRPLHARAGQRRAIDAYLTAAALGSVLAMTGDDDGALDLFYQALALARLSGQDPLLVNALNNLGSYQMDLYNLDDAAPLLQECLAGAQRLGSRRQIIYAAGNLVQCLCLMGHASQALEIARRHLIGHIRADDPPALQRDEEIALVYLENDLIDEAQAALEGTASVDPMSNELATARVCLASRILLARGLPDAALRSCLARQALLRANGQEGTVAIDRVDLLRVTAQAAHQVGDHELAYRQLGEAFAEHEQLLGRAARSRQLSLQISHRLRQAEWERDAAKQVATQLEVLNESLRAQVAENRRLQALLQAQAFEDPLTGLYNRRHLLQAGTAMLSRLRRRAAPMAVVIVDLDHFKRINDRHGHEAGDRVLKAFADLVCDQTRAEDIACRYGGEEFVLLIPDARAIEAGARVRQLLRAFGDLRFKDSKGDLFACTFSAGVVDSVEGDDTLTELLARADAALYVAKEEGRASVRTMATA